MVEWIADSTSRRPWVVVTTPIGQGSPRFDMESLEDQLSGVASIILVTTVDATRAMTDVLREREDVFAGAARVYPAGYTPENTLKPSPPRLVHPNQRPSSATQALISDALSIAQSAGVFDEPQPQQRPASGVIKGFIGDDRAFVSIDDGQELATLAAELTCPGVPLSWLFAIGQQIPGSYDAVTGRFLADRELVHPATYLQSFPMGAVTLGLVTEVERQRGSLRTHPGHTFSFSRAAVSPNSKDRVDLLLAAGEVVAVRIYRDQQGNPSVRMDDIDDDEPVILPPDFGAGPWLIEGRELLSTHVEEHVEEPVDAPAVETPLPIEQPARPKPGPGVVQAVALPDEADPGAVVTPPPGSPRSVLRGIDNQLHAARAERDQLQARLSALGADRAEELFHTLQNERDYFAVELARAQADLRAARADLSDFRKRSRGERASSGTASGPWDRESRFSSRDDWVREEVRRTWLSLYSPQEREVYVLAQDSWNMGSKFAESLGDLKNSQLRRVFKLILHIVSGRNSAEGIVEVHPLRLSDERDAPPHLRADGAVCLRAYVEEGVPQSRRLHYWKVSDRLVELSRVVMHDDFHP